MMRFKVFSITLHIAGWLLFLMFPLLFMNGNNSGTISELIFSWPYLQFCVVYVILFYTNTLLLIPAFFLKKKYLVYGMLILLLGAGVFYLHPFAKLLRLQNESGQLMRPGSLQPVPGIGMGRQEPPGPPPSRKRPAGDSFRMLPPGHDGQFNGPEPPGRRPYPVDITAIFIYIIIITFGTSAAFMKQWQETEQRAIRAEADKANAELSFLKAQVNPHFLYNTLNNIYTLSVLGSDHTSESIMKLSDIMRYITDEAGADFVPLEHEINCITNYIDLQRLRTGEKTGLDYMVQGDPQQWQIAPLILMTFIENVFKYGVSKHEESIIRIHITISPEKIFFFSQNRIFDRQPVERTGIGIQNTRQRLNHLYPSKHQLDIGTNDHLFTVQLSLYA